MRSSSASERPVRPSTVRIGCLCPGIRARARAWVHARRQPHATVGDAACARASASPRGRRASRRSRTARLGAGRYPASPALPSPARPRAHVSTSTVTGPSLTSATLMCAPNSPRSAPRARRSARTAAGPARRARRRRSSGGCPARVAVQRELADAEDLAVAERLVHAPVGVGEDAQSRAPSRPGARPRAASSSREMPSSTSRPAPIAATGARRRRRSRARLAARARADKCRSNSAAAPRRGRGARGGAAAARSRRANAARRRAGHDSRTSIAATDPRETSPDQCPSRDGSTPRRPDVL